jgi:penicillin-binding protein 1A
VQVEKMLDEAAKTAGNGAPGDPTKPAKPLSSTSLAFPESFAAATPGEPPTSAARKN